MPFFIYPRRGEEPKLWKPSKAVPENGVYYATDDYNVATRIYDTPGVKIAPEAQLVEAYEGFKQIKDALLELGLTVPDEDDETVFKFEQIHENGVTAALFNHKIPNPFFSYHLIRGNVTEVRRIAGQATGRMWDGTPKGNYDPNTQKNNFTADEIIADLHQGFENNKFFLERAGVETTLTNIRKLWLFRSDNHIRRYNWLDANGVFADSVFRFIRNGASLDHLFHFHRGHTTSDNKLMQTGRVAMLSAEEADSILSIPFTLVKQLYATPQPSTNRT